MKPTACSIRHTDKRPANACHVCNPRPPLTNPSRPSVQCPACGDWIRLNLGSKVCAVRCMCQVDERGRGVLVWCETRL